jgi:hypothetical protein
MGYNDFMRKEKTLFIIGLWVIVLPFLGFPGSWKTILFVLTGLALVYLSYLFYMEVKARLAKSDNQTKSFIDNIEEKKQI